MSGGSLVLGQQRCVFFGRYANRERLQTDRPIAYRDFRDPTFEAEYPQQGRTELLQMAVGLKGHQVGSEQALQELLAPRQYWEDFSRWKRNMQKKADGRIRQRNPQHLREQH